MVFGSEKRGDGKMSEMIDEDIPTTINLSDEFLDAADEANLFGMSGFHKLVLLGVMQRIDSEMVAMLTGRPPEYSDITKAVMSAFNILEPSQENESGDVFPVSAIKSAMGAYNCNRSVRVECW